jgi:hypothetical protein
MKPKTLTCPGVGKVSTFHIDVETNDVPEMGAGWADAPDFSCAVPFDLADFLQKILNV